MIGLLLLVSCVLGGSVPTSEPPEWKPLNGGWGTSLAVSGDRIVAASTSQLSVWSRDGLRTAHPAGLVVGTPRFVGAEVLVGGNVLGPDGRVVGVYPDLEDPAEALVAAAWSPDGQTLVGATTQTRLVWSGRDGAIRRTVSLPEPVSHLWTDGTQTVAAGAGLFVVRGDEVQRFDAHPGGTSAISASSDDALLLTVGTGGPAHLWNTDTWGHTSWEGAWIGGALDPLGRAAAVFDAHGEVTVACVDGFKPIHEVQAPGLAALVLSGNRLVGAFHQAPRVRTTSVENICPPPS